MGIWKSMNALQSLLAVIRLSCNIINLSQSQSKSLYRFSTRCSEWLTSDSDIQQLITHDVRCRVVGALHCDRRLGVCLLRHSSLYDSLPANRNWLTSLLTTWCSTLMFRAFDLYSRLWMITLFIQT